MRLVPYARSALTAALRAPPVWAVLPAAACGAVVYLLMMSLFADEFALKLCRRLTGSAG